MVLTKLHTFSIAIILVVSLFIILVSVSKVEAGDSAIDSKPLLIEDEFSISFSGNQTNSTRKTDLSTPLETPSAYEVGVAQSLSNLRSVLPIIYANESISNPTNTLTPKQTLEPIIVADSPIPTKTPTINPTPAPTLQTEPPLPSTTSLPRTAPAPNYSESTLLYQTGSVAAIVAATSFVALALFLKQRARYYSTFQSQQKNRRRKNTKKKNLNMIKKKARKTISHKSNVAKGIKKTTNVE